MEGQGLAAVLLVLHDVGGLGDALDAGVVVVR